MNHGQFAATDNTESITLNNATYEPDYRLVG